MRRFAKRLVVLAIVNQIVPSAAFADWLVDGVLLPGEAKVEASCAAVPDQQRFLGAWVGRWGDTVKHILIVESVQPDGSASVIYAWGDNPGLSITPGFYRLSANLSGDTLTIESSFTATYKLTSATSATASYRRGEREPLLIPRSPRCSSRRATLSPSRNGAAVASRRDLRRGVRCRPQSRLRLRPEAVPAGR